MGYDNVARAWPPPSTQEADALKIGFHHLQSDLKAMTGGTLRHHPNPGSTEDALGSAVPVSSTTDLLYLNEPSLGSSSSPSKRNQNRPMASITHDHAAKVFCQGLAHQ